MFRQFTIGLFPLAALLAGCAPGAVPTALTDLEGTAEDAYDKALVSDYAAVTSDSDVLVTGWSTFRSQAEADGASPTDLTAMDDAIAALADAAAHRDGLTDAELARAANMVSGPMDELFALYPDKVPAPILALDYGGREVSLDAMETGMDDAAADVAELQAVWSGVRQQVVDAGGGAEAADYDATLATQLDLISASDATALLDESNHGLELVDALEGVF